MGRPYRQEIVVTGVAYLDDFKILVTFADGFRREVDLWDHLRGPAFEPLRDRLLFSQVRFDPEVGTAVWPTGADIAPEFLRWGPHLPSGCPCGHEGP